MASGWLLGESAGHAQRLSETVRRLRQWLRKCCNFCVLITVQLWTDSATTRWTCPHPPSPFGDNAKRGGATGLGLGGKYTIQRPFPTTAWGGLSTASHHKTVTKLGFVHHKPMDPGRTRQEAEQAHTFEGTSEDKQVPHALDVAVRRRAGVLEMLRNRARLLSTRTNQVTASARKRFWARLHVGDPFVKRDSVLLVPLNPNPREVYACTTRRQRSFQPGTPRSARKASLSLNPCLQGGSTPNGVIDSNWPGSGWGSNHKSGRKLDYWWLSSRTLEREISIDTALYNAIVRQQCCDDWVHCGRGHQARERVQ